MAKTKVTAVSKPPPRAPLPKGWPVSSTSSKDRSSLTPGALLQTTCNGSDVFLRKRATQPPTTSWLPTATKGGPTRFLVIFPGRMSLKLPKAPMDKDEPQEDGRDGPKDTSTGGTTTKKKHPFVSTHPPQLLGKLQQLENDTLQLSIPFTTSDEDDTQTNHDQPSQLIFRGKHIVTQGKFLTLTFKRTGGKDGSITCKDVFQSVLVLGERQWKKNHPSENEETKEGVVVMNHYGGSDRTVDGGGCVDSGVVSSKKSLRKGECHSESNSDVHSVEDVSEAYSEDEFVPQMAKKNTTKRSKADDEEKPIVSHPKRTSRRSASKALNVSYADEESDVDLGDDGSSDSEENSHDESQRTDDEFDECLDTKAKKKPRYALQPMSKKNQVSSVLDADVIQSNKPSTPKKSCVKKASSTSLNSPISPRRRKKASPQKSPSPSKRNIMDLSDDSFTFL